VLVAAAATYMRITSGFTVILTLLLFVAAEGGWRNGSPAPWRRNGKSFRRGLLRFAPAMLVYLALVAPLLGYYWLEYGSPLYAQRLVYWDYFVHHTTGNWVVDVRTGSDQHYEIPPTFSYLDIFAGWEDFTAKMGDSLARLFAPTTTLHPSHLSLYFPHAVFASFYLAGLVGMAVLRRRRSLLAFFLGYALPFLPLAFLPELGARFFIPSLTLAYLIAATALQDSVTLMRSDS
jgi:hypothetical protein